MKRIKGWESILGEQLRAAQKKTFKWGVHDCSLWVCDVVLAMTGTDLAHDFRGKYTTRHEARMLIKQFAGSDLEQLALKRAAEFDMEQIDPRKASRGDIVVIYTGARKALGIVGPSAIDAYCVGLKGLTPMPRGTWLRAWRV